MLFLLGHGVCFAHRGSSQACSENRKQRSGCPAAGPDPAGTKGNRRDGYADNAPEGGKRNHMPYHPKRRLKLSGNARKRNRRTAEKHRKLLRLSLLIVFCLMIGYGMGLLIPYAADLIASRQVSREMQRIQSQALPDQDASKQAFAEAVSAAFAPLSATDTPQPAPAALPGGSDHAGTLQPVKYPDNPTLKISDRFKNLRKKGEYIVGWIRFDELDEPVAQKDNSYFLNRDATGKRNSNDL